MNSLSWLLYWADVLPRYSTWMSFLSFFLFAVSIVCVFFYYLGSQDTRERRGKYVPSENRDPLNDDPWEYILEYTDEARVCRSLGWSRWTAFLFFILWGVSFMVPSKETFYMIAASQAGEQAMQTPEFSKARAVINKFLDDQLKNEEPKAVNEESK